MVIKADKTPCISRYREHCKARVCGDISTSAHNWPLLPRFTTNRASQFLLELYNWNCGVIHDLIIMTLKVFCHLFFFSLHVKQHRREVSFPATRGRQICLSLHFTRASRSCSFCCKLCVWFCLKIPRRDDEWWPELQFLNSCSILFL